jgi:hypothetical protein
VRQGRRLRGRDLPDRYGGVQAVGVFSGHGAASCDIVFTDIYNAFLALPGDVKLY